MFFHLHDAPTIKKKSTLLKFMRLYSGIEPRTGEGN